MALEKIKTLASENQDQWVSWRRHLHRHPELSFQEKETHQYIWKQLDEMGITDKQVMSDTGIVALIKGNNPDKRTVAVRGDIDALPIQEANEVEYKSAREGVMHACGHDVHTTCVLGTAQILNSLKHEFEGTVKLVFQPGEERLPGGASLMIKDGVLENPKVEHMLGQHVMPLIDAGKVGFRKGLYMASADEIYITIKGKGGHGAHPHQNTDVVAIGAQLITSLQQVVSRKAKPATPSVLSIGKVVANGATNILPNEIYMEGTFRTFDETWREEAHEWIVRMTESLVNGMGAEVDVEVKKGYPFLKNDDEFTDRCRARAENYLGAENVEDLEIWPAGEDFAYFSQEVPSCFYRLGIRNEERGITSMLHTPTFDIDEKALEVGVGLMAYLTWCELVE
jgi:amidohydrolase